MAKRFGSAAAFKASLEAHLRKEAAGRGKPLGTLQLKLVIERLLARLFHAPDPPWLLKGGFAMDLRFRPKARTTKDVDLTVAVAALDPRTPTKKFRIIGTIRPSPYTTGGTTDHGGPTRDER